MNSTTTSVTKKNTRKAAKPILTEEEQEKRDVARDVVKWKRAAQRIRTLADVGLTVTRAYGMHVLSSIGGAPKPAVFESDVAEGKLRILYWGFGFAVAIDVSDTLETIGSVLTLGWVKGGHGPLEVHVIGYIDLDGEFTDIIDMAGTDLTLPFTRTTLPPEVLDGVRGAQ